MASQVVSDLSEPFCEMGNQKALIFLPIALLAQGGKVDRSLARAEDYLGRGYEQGISPPLQMSPSTPHRLLSPYSTVLHTLAPPCQILKGEAKAGIHEASWALPHSMALFWFFFPPT